MEEISVPYADKTITEITCHGKGAHYLLGKDATIIDIGGQDTKNNYPRKWKGYKLYNE